jgi:hypothetical protein
VGRPSKEWGEDVIAFVVAKPGKTVETSDLDRHCLEHIARFKRPKSYIFESELPKNNYGKVLKTALRARLAGKAENLRGRFMKERFLEGRTALVTGSVQGIGLAIGRALASAGARLAVHGLATREQTDAAVRTMREAGAPDARFFDADMRKPAAIEAMMETVISRDQLGVHQRCHQGKPGRAVAGRPWPDIARCSRTERIYIIGRHHRGLTHRSDMPELCACLRTDFGPVAGRHSSIAPSASCMSKRDAPPGPCGPKRCRRRNDRLDQSKAEEAWRLYLRGGRQSCDFGSAYNPIRLQHEPLPSFLLSVE